MFHLEEKKVIGKQNHIVIFSYFAYKFYIKIKEKFMNILENICVWE